ISSPGWAKWAWSTFFSAFNAEATSMVYAYSGFNPPKVLEFITEYGVNTLCAPPTVWRMFILEDLERYNWDNLREAVSAGEPLNPKVIETVKEKTGVTIREGYGQTETTLQIGYFPGLEVKPGSMGKPAPGYDIVLVDPEGNPVPVGEDGQIAIRIEPERPLGLMKGYDDPREEQERVQAGALLDRRRRHDGPGRLPILRGQSRRRLQEQRLQDQPLRGRERADKAPGGRGGGGGAEPAPHKVDRAEGLHRAQARLQAEPRTG
ncbi:MAG: AMP-binding protein, partial [Desulfurococcales archaeon]|nr:AMP-binding protein [Desulfurococcales archaeon]